MLDEGFNPYESNNDSSASQYIRRAGAARGVSVVEAPSSASIMAPTTPAAIRDFDFAAAMFNDDNAWRELARAIAGDAA